MTLVAVKDKREIYERVLRARQASLERHPPHISVRAPDLDEQVRNNLQSEIQAVLDRTLQLRKPVQVEPPSNEQVRHMIRSQFRSAPPGESRQRPSRNGEVRVDMSGLRLPTEDRQALESEVRQLVLKHLDGVSPHWSRQAPVVCGCTFGFGCCDLPGQTLDLMEIDPIPWPGDPRIDPAVIGVFSGSDMLMMSIWAPDVEHGDPDLTLDQMMVGLRIDSSFDPDQWAKEIDGWAFCQCGVPGYKVHQDHPTVGYHG